MSKYYEDLDYLIQDVDISKTELEEIIAEADKIISDTTSGRDKLIEAYLKKVQCLQKLNKFDDSRKIIYQLLNLSPDKPEALVRLGKVFYEEKEYDKAFDVLNKAIELKPNYALAYAQRGTYKDNLSDYFGAITDYNRAIELNPDLSVVYNNRGVTKSNLKDYQGAIEDYNKAIDLKLNFAFVYNNRGVAKSKLLNYSDAIEDYSKAIDIDPKYELALKNRGVAFNKIKEKHKNTATDFRKAGTDLLNVLTMNNGKEIVKLMLDEYDFFIEATESKKEERENYKDIYIESLEIITRLQVKDEKEMPVSHYSKKEIAAKLLFDDYFKNKNDEYLSRDCFRLNSVNTSNDPEEGKTLFHYLFPHDNISLQVEEFGAFAGCFILNKDSLNQFRLYGKTEDNVEGTGISIVLNKHFFSEEISMPLQTESIEKDDSLPKTLPLFRCIYIDPETNKVVSLGQKEEYVFYRENNDKEDESKVEEVYKKYKGDIDKTLEDINNRLINLTRLIREKQTDSDIVYKLLLNLRYLVKHAAFKEEQECRIIQIKKLNDKDNVISDENNRLYVEYQKLHDKNVSEICFAPKAQDIGKFKQHLARNNYSIKCYKSNAPLA